VFGVSFSEVAMVAIVALVVAGPKRLPEMLGQLGAWIGKLRRMVHEMRRQTGIDDILRQEGFSGGINELRSMIRGEVAAGQRALTLDQRPARPVDPMAVVDSHGDALHLDRYREFPIEGPDTYGAIPEDLVDDVLATAAPAEPGAKGTSTEEKGAA